MSLETFLKIVLAVVVGGYLWFVYILFKEANKRGISDELSMGMPRLR